MEFRRLAALAIAIGAAASWLVHSNNLSCSDRDKSTYTQSSYKVKKGETIICSNKMVTRRMATGEFNTIKADDAITVEYTPSAAPMNVRLYASDNLIDYIRLSVKKGVLTVDVDRKYSSDGKNGPKIIISGSGLRNFILSGAVGAVVTAPLVVSGDMTINLEGASGFTMLKDLKCGRIRIEEDGASQVTMNVVSATDVTAECEGSSNIRINGLSVSNSIKMSAEGASTINLTDVTAPTLSVEVSGSSSAILTGHVTNGIFSASGSSGIKAGELMCIRANATASGVSNIECNAESLTKVATSGLSNITNNR